MADEESASWRWWVGGAALLISAGVGYYLLRPQPPKPTPAPPVVAAPATPPATPQYPVERIPDAPQAPAALAEALPELFDSDAGFRSGLEAMFDPADLAAILVADQFIARFVATVDALPNRKCPPALWPVKPTPGSYQVQDSGLGHLLVADSNAARYNRAVALFDSIDPVVAAAFYKHWYPLFQNAYRELGYPQGHFNDRLIAVIDHLLASPEPAQSPALMVGDHGYVFADPELESASAGHKLMLRLGSAHAATAKAKLRALRVALSAGAP